MSFLSYNFTEFPWILALFPSVLTIRGDISGILSGKLGTMLHTGRIRASFTKNTQEFYLLLKSIFVLALLDTIGMSFFSFLLNLSIGNATKNHLPIYLILPSFVCLASVAVSMPITIAVGILGFKKGLNPDIIVYPAMSTINDVIVAFLFFIAVKSIEDGFIPFLAIFSLISSFLILLLSKGNIRNLFFRKNIREGVSSIFLSSLLGTFSGSILSTFRLDIESHTGLIAIYPAMMDTIGDIGSIIGSITTTKLAIGVGNSFKRRVQLFIKDALEVEISAITVFSILGFLGGFFSKGDIGKSTVTLVKLALFTNILGFLMISLLSFIIAERTFKKGWDPDNFVIPIVTSSADFITTVFLFLGIYLLG